MAGVRKSVFRGGGGFLNNSDGTIVDIQFTDQPPFNNEGGYLYATLAIQEDGKDAPTEQSLFVGGTAEEFGISEDGHSLTPAEAGRNISRGTAFADFIASIDATDHPGTQADVDDRIDYTPIIGSRLRFEQLPLDAAELAKLKAKGKPTSRLDKNDPSKSYPLTKTVVTKFYAMEKVASKAAAPVAKGTKSVADVRAQLAARRKTA